jgi:Phosphotransferase enzyme family
VSRAPVAVLREGLASHPAARAWAGLASPATSPCRIEVLRERAPSAVYRLIGAAPGGVNVIAKRWPAGHGAVELYVYEHILPRLALGVPRRYGVWAEGDGGSEPARWLFLEDVGTERYSDAIPAHRALTARWAAAMHQAAAEIDTATQLPDGGPDRYLGHLRAARDRITRRLEHVATLGTDSAPLDEIVVRLDSLARQWSAVERACTGLPATLVHGDFRPKNVYVRTIEGRLECRPIDWETAGWGVPAIDLTRIDVATYWGLARNWLIGLDPDRVRQLAGLGHVFRTVAAIDWESTGLAFESPRMISRPMASLRVLLSQLLAVVRSAGLQE